jgi:predicted pyridoxine 5'-phosphate oxidase superfamily flavin-nucleotide-binding protein
MSEPEVFHAGEIAAQERAGERAVARRRGPMIGDRLVDAARAFLSHQGVVAVGAAGSDGTLWASLWCGAPGFLRSDELGEHVEVSSALGRTLSEDPVRPLLQTGAPFAMLVIDFETRRRLRINGTVSRNDATALELHVRETFGNCSKYIQRRERRDEPSSGPPMRIERGRALDDERRSVIARTDTVFVTSIHPERGLDVSHRGGHPGFVKLDGERMLRLPDYPGNSMFQTLGNFEVDPRAGLALIDFERCRVLSLTGNAVAAFSAEDPGHPIGGTGRYWCFTVEQWVEFSLPPTMRWTLIERSPFNPSPNDASADSVER